MTPLPVCDDPLSQWLSEAGRSTLDALTASAADIVGVVDRNLTIRYLNRSGPHLNRDSVVGQTIASITPAPFQQQAEAAYRRVLETGITTEYDVACQDASQRLQWDVRLGPIRQGDEIIGIIALTTEVSGLRRAQADRDRFFLLSLDMLAVGDSEGRFRRLNPAFSEALGYSLSELEGRQFLDFVHPDDLQTTAAVFQTMLNGARITDFVNRYRCKDGSYRVFSWRATFDPVTGDAYAVARDVTEQRSTEQQLLHAQKMEAIGQLAGGVAHDFNNLMMAVLANTELAKEETKLATVGERLAAIEEAAQRAAGLTRQLLSFSRRRPLNPVALDLNQLVHGLMKMLRRLLPESISIDLTSDAQLSLVSADPTQIEQVIVNLCVNARDAMPSAGRLAISTRNVSRVPQLASNSDEGPSGHCVRLRVSDTGIGMNERDQARAFEPFFSTKPAHQGTGLGLSTVYGIIRQHSGVVEIQSTPGAGATFDIYLPATDRVSPVEEGSFEPLPERGAETILLAEDEAQVRHAVSQILQKAGYRVLAARNGREAIALVRNSLSPPDLALLDVVMPELGGPETWLELQTICPSLRVVFATGYADTRYLERLPAGATVLEKPFHTAEMLRHVRQALDAKQASSSEQESFGEPEPVIRRE